ncbi:MULTISPECIES: PLP-dependent aminotransferase family protein [unclassified Marinobacter]|uniref:aminotransferase-like domain-containing protein n=1 Tax=unclassified Marinobacter TaxID=83889 RepID=UPI000BF53B49|nr:MULTISPECIES: PLP-dependent aminotransferase family protein [unclassified Marinobacter]PFG09627.1 DNA-binding transcriptional MocR family regulator [Marinobacter sp. LV10MA510-1]PFG51551.1 DNA-binding transcriptional MocR family regulator [Marinobacter sp. LV10R520-4]
MGVKPNIDTVLFLKEALIAGQGTKYMRLANAFEEKISDDFFQEGTKLPPHRRLADQLGVTPGTISRAYEELERMGLVQARVGDGTFVSKRSMEREREEGFRNFIEKPLQRVDMSRNMHIPGQETILLAEALRRLADDQQTLHEIALYTPEAGLSRYRRAGAAWLSTDNFEANADQVLCVNGGQHGLLCALMALLRPGDTLVTEQLTYPGLISAARFLGIRLLGAEMDDQGLIPESLEEICRKNRVSALYCTPTIQNPTTAVLSAERREAIATICRSHNLFIIEDEAHAVFVEDRPPQLSQYAPERGVILSSLSKAVAAGFRVGYIYAPAQLIDRLVAALRATCWMATPLTFELASLWIEDGSAKALLKQQVAEIRRRKDLVAGLLSGLNVRTHPHSPHFWIEVPEPWRASEVEIELRQKNHLVAAAEAFAVGRGAVPQYIRASISTPFDNDKVLYNGFATLAATLQQTSLADAVE